MNKQLISIIFITFFLFLVVAIPQIAYCQTATPTATPTATEKAAQGPLNLLLIGGIIAVVVVVVAVASVFVLKKRMVNEKSLRKFPSRDFEEWVIKKFNGKSSDPSSGVSGFTQGGQPLLIRQSDVSLAEVEDFVKLLVKGKAQKGVIVAFNFDKDTVEGKLIALDNEVELQLLPISELLNKRYMGKIEGLARSPVTFEAPLTAIAEEQIGETRPFEKMPDIQQNEGLKPRVFVSNSNTKVTEQVKKMLEFLHYDYVIGDKAETSVPISDKKFDIMKGCDCAIINISAAEQERRYSGLYILNSNVISEINAAYLKYNMQIILLVEKKIELTSNLKGLKRIEYDSDDLSFDAAMDLEKKLADFKKI
jgi:Predicted nucleotide-binding protein containing TIR-like domain